MGTSKGKADKAFHSLKGEHGGVNPALVIGWLFFLSFSYIL